MEEKLPTSAPQPQAALAAEASDPALDYGIPLPVLPIPLEQPRDAASAIDHTAQRTRRFIWSIITSFLTRPLAVVISLVSVPLFLKYLGRERYGVYEWVGSLAVWLGMTNAGLSLGLVNKLADCYVTGDKALARRYVTAIMLAIPVLALAVAILLTIVTPFVPWAKLWGSGGAALAHETAWAFWWAGLITLVGVVVSASGAIYLGYQEIVKNNLWDGVAKIVTLLACVGIVFTPLGVTGAILATAGAPTLVRGINMLLIFGYEKPFLRPARSAFDWRLLRALITEGAALLILQLSALALFQTDKMIIGLIKGPTAVTEFSVIGRLYFTAYAMFVLMIGPLWPTAAEAIRRGDIPWVRRTLRRALMISTFGMLAVGIVMYFFGSRVVNLWTAGVQPTVSRALIVGLTVTFMARCWTECQSTVLNAASVLREQAVLLVTNAALNCVAAVFLVYKFGVVGAAWSIPLTTILTSGWMYPRLIRKYIYGIRSA